MAANRKRAWFACILVHGLNLSRGEIDNLAGIAEEVMQHLSASSTTTDVDIEQMLDSVAPEDKEHWLSRANAEGFGLARSMPEHGDCYHLAKWRSLHREAFRKAGLAYPPVFSDRLQTVINISSLREREADI